MDSISAHGKFRYLEDLWCLKPQVKHDELGDPICEPAREEHCVTKMNICSKVKFPLCMI